MNTICEHMHAYSDDKNIIAIQSATIQHRTQNSFIMHFSTLWHYTLHPGWLSPPIHHNRLGMHSIYTQPVRITHYALRITHYALRITHYALNITHYTLHITHYALRITHYALHIHITCIVTSQTSNSTSGLDSQEDCHGRQRGTMYIVHVQYQ